MTAATTRGDRNHFVPLFRVFEHDRLRIGDEIGGQVFTARHFNALVRLSEQYRQRYFTIGHQSVHFRHFVGMLATPELTVEILPKLDRDSGLASGSWQAILVDLLAACRFVRAERTGRANLNTRPGDLLEWYLRTFSSELQLILQRGLKRTYHVEENNLPVLKGRLHLPRQLRRNTAHRERFFVTHNQYTVRHPANLIIGAALQQLRMLGLTPDLRPHFTYLSQLFPRPTSLAELEGIDLPALLRDYRLESYHYALTIARHILQGERPGIRAGTFRGLSLLFDMNQLFEEYLFRQLIRWKPPGMQIERQESRPFWGFNRLRPDLVVSGPQGRWVLDTKWRVLHTGQPTADELRQIYVYCDYFDAGHGVLIFPHAAASPPSYHRSFAATSDLDSNRRHCHLYFARILQSDGRLNSELGQQLFTDLITRNNP